MKTTTFLLATLISTLAFTSAPAAEIPPQLVTPGRIQTSLGMLEFRDDVSIAYQTKVS
jgi:hypothetical protein